MGVDTRRGMLVLFRFSAIKQDHSKPSSYCSPLWTDQFLEQVSLHGSAGSNVSRGGIWPILPTAQIASLQSHS